MLRLSLLLLALSGVAHAQSVTITGLDGNTREISAAELAAMPHQTARLAKEGGGSRTYDGVPLSALLARSGAPLGKALRGPALADIVVVEAKDGYRVALALSDVDPAFHPGPVLLADRADGKPLAEPEGPFRLVVAGDGRPARSARMVVAIKIEAAP